MPNAEDADMDMIKSMGGSNDALSEALRKKKKKEDEEAKLKAYFDAPKKQFIPD